MTAQKTRPSQWIAIAATLFGIAAAYGVYYLLPDMHWAVYVVVGFVVAGPAYQTWLSMVADERIIDNYPASDAKPPLRVMPVIAPPPPEETGKVLENDVGEKLKAQRKPSDGPWGSRDI